jgi:phospholipid-binding lipoprotein MlaA
VSAEQMDGRNMARRPTRPGPAAVVGALAVMLLAGCASLGNDSVTEGAERAGRDERTERNARIDPYEPFNRRMHTFNEQVDALVLRPVAVGYSRYVPEVFRFLAGNFVSHLYDPYIGLNNLLQGKPAAAASDLTRFTLNTFFGFLGIADPATEMGFPKHREDFGQTLGVWGVSPGPYLVLPFLGPTTVRDGVGRGAEAYSGLVVGSDNASFRASTAALEVVQIRVSLLPADQMLRDALDRYLLVRDSYLQRRRNLVHDGNPPPED